MHMPLNVLYPITLQVIAQTTHSLGFFHCCLLPPAKSAACVRLKRQLILELHIWTIIDTCAHTHTRAGAAGAEWGKRVLGLQMHFRRVQLLILPSHSALLLSILSAIKYSMHRAASRTKQVKISITKNAHVLRCPVAGERARERDREGEWGSRCYSAQKTVGARPRCVLLSAAYMLRLRSSFRSSLLLLLLLGFWGANRAAHAPKIIP